MFTIESFGKDLYRVNGKTFDEIALRLFFFQSRNCPVYATYLHYLGVDASKVDTIDQIPFLPISFFKSQDIRTGSWDAETVFRSSGTTGSTPSRHYIRSLDAYHRNARACFGHFFGKIDDYVNFALVPTYQERGDSSLVSMINHFILSSGDRGGYYLGKTGKLVAELKNLNESKDSGKALVWGVTFALLDLAQGDRPDLGNCLIIETGGMKGRRKELTRNELHAVLKEGLNARVIISEYGMTELMSQAYAVAGTRFRFPPWARVRIRDINDPMHHDQSAGAGVISIIDLANYNSVAFIETGDLGRVFADGSFEVLGRLDNSDIRGCSLMIS